MEMTRDDGSRFGGESAPGAEIKELRAETRQRYIRAHAPTILAGFLSCVLIDQFDDARRRSIEQAGLLFDETEAL